ncbi:OmpA family protein [Dyadobacter pollutisoli]|uniref:OmpA family protein n=1 Tax=Dyadobacter pollutisoli TaxID=2910158 RepID=A0A9E8N9R2_9BACT|nr:OmpA family protein [Dyadobacter pollutisoli]WAC11076.1 OmpA family protein [Dyadobacter pollutisoli]
MNFKLLTALLCAFVLALDASFGQITDNPKVLEQSQPDVKIKKVELTDKYTIIYLQFEEKASNQTVPKGFPFLQRPDQKLQQQQSAGEIWLDPETRLYKPGEIDKKFKLIRTENIPTETRKQINEGEKVDFVAYFERLTPGIEEFDFYEGRSSKGYHSWNFYGVRIKNPLKKQANDTAKSTAKAQVPVKKPVEKPAPKQPEQPLADSTDAKVAGIAVMKGTIYNSKTKKPISGQISYVEKGDSLQIKSSSGKYRIGIDPAEKYDFRIVAKGFYGTTFPLVPADSAGQSAFDQDFYLTPLTVGETIVLPNIYFATSQYTLLAESYAELDRLVDMMRENPDIQIRVEGHTDNVGDFDKNLELSRKRAESVQTYLVEKGIDTSRIEAKGYGGTRPIGKGNSAEAHQKNRRVEFVITQA